MTLRATKLRYNFNASVNLPSLCACRVFWLITSPFPAEALMRKLTQVLLLAGTSAMAFSAIAKDAGYIGEIDVVHGDSSADTATGKVFLDTNRNSRLDAGEAGLAGVLVSNGREVVATGEDGSYTLPAYDDMNLFITKPAGYMTPVSDDMIPQFSYVHKVAGSANLRFGGIEPTGPLPQSVNFPLVEDPVGDEFQCLVFGDTQPYSNQEVSYVRQTVGKLLTNRDNSATQCLLFQGDVMGDDLSLYPRFKQIVAKGGVPQYYVAGNHDLDFDAKSDADSFDTFRREFGPEYYSFDIGQVHFVVLDDVRYPCNGVDAHAFCDLSAKPSYNGVISERQLEWLKNDLANVPENKLIVVSAHIPFVTYTDATAQKHQVDNLDKLYDLIGDRPALGLSGHTHTTEQILPGEFYKGWEEATGTGPAKFHQIITGAVSGSWWAGDLNNSGVPHATQRLGSPRGYYVLDFAGSDYVDTFLTFEGDENDQLHVSFNTPRFRDWAEQLVSYTTQNDIPNDITPPVTVNDLGDMDMLTRADLSGTTYVAINVWNGSKESQVSFSINGGDPIEAERTQKGEGEEAFDGPTYSDPLAMAKQSTNGRQAVRSTTGGDATAGYRTWQGLQWTGVAGPFQDWMLTTKSSHLWRAELPGDLPAGVHTLEVRSTDRFGRMYKQTKTFEVVDELPQMTWQEKFWNE